MPSWQGRCAVRDAGVHVVVRACKNDVRVLCVYCAAMGLGGSLGDSSTYVCVAQRRSYVRGVGPWVSGLTWSRRRSVAGVRTATQRERARERLGLAVAGWLAPSIHGWLARAKRGVGRSISRSNLSLSTRRLSARPARQHVLCLSVDDRANHAVSDKSLYMRYWPLYRVRCVRHERADPFAKSLYAVCPYLDS